MSLQTFLDNFALLADTPNGVQKLRELILQLAVQGKLVRQNPQAEQASVALEGIKEEKEASGDKRWKKKVEFPSLSLAEAPFTIPSGWLWIRLGELASLIEYGTSEKASLHHAGVPVFRMNNIDGGRVVHSNMKYVSPAIKDLPRLYLKTNELLFNRTNSFELVGKTGIFKGDSDKFTFASYLIRIRLFDSHVFPDYVNLAMNADYFRKTQINTEVTQQCGQANFNGTKLANTLIPFPPLEEQKRIVAKVDELMWVCDELDARQQARRESRMRLNNATLAPLNKAASLAPAEFEQASVRLADNFTALYDSAEAVSKLRSTILQLAVQGKLTRQDSQDEPTSVWLEKVGREKKRLIKEGKLSNKRPSTEIKDDEKVFELPESWSWVRLGDVVDQRLGKMLDKGKNKGRPYPYLRNTNVQWLRFDLSDVKEMRFEDSELREYEVRVGDLLVCEGGEPGRCAIWDGQVEQIMFQKAIHRVRPFVGIQSRFLLYRLLADATTGSLEKHFTGATIKHLTGQELAKYVVGLPPVEEQKRIVAKVNQLMALCDELESKLRQAEADSEKLMNAAVQHVLASITEGSTGILAGVTA